MLYLRWESNYHSLEMYKRVILQKFFKEHTSLKTSTQETPFYTSINISTFLNAWLHAEEYKCVSWPRLANGLQQNLKTFSVVNCAFSGSERLLKR